jgi:hypothetical protein
MGSGGGGGGDFFEFLESLEEGLDDGFGEEMLQAFVDVFGGHFGDLFDEGAGDMSETVGGHEEDGFDVIVEDSVGECHGEFCIEVREGADAAEEDFASGLFDELDGEAVEGADIDIGDVLECRFAEFDAFIGREEGIFVGVDTDADDDKREDAGGAEDDILVS